jgi:hypothetical protein
MKKKALSFEEKRTRLLAILHEKKEVMNLKELERLGAKAGIVLQTVREVLDSLISDYLVESDKIGAANFYWSLPSRAYQGLVTKRDELKEAIDKLETERQRIGSEITLAKEGKQDCQERSEKLEKLKSLKSQLRSGELESYQRNDPSRLESVMQQSDHWKNEANRWTDNIFICKEWLKKRLVSVTESEINENFGIPEDMDNI